MTPTPRSRGRLLGIAFILLMILFGALYYLYTTEVASGDYVEGEWDWGDNGSSDGGTSGTTTTPQDEYSVSSGTALFTVYLVTRDGFEFMIGYQQLGQFSLYPPDFAIDSLKIYVSVYVEFTNPITKTFTVVYSANVKVVDEHGYIVDSFSPSTSESVEVVNGVLEYSKNITLSLSDKQFLSQVDTGNYKLVIEPVIILYSDKGYLGKAVVERPIEVYVWIEDGMMWYTGDNFV